MAGYESQYLTGKLLVAMPSLGDPRFQRAVIFICAHDAGGAMGLVINHVMPGVDFKELVKQLKIQSDIKVNFKDLSLPVMYGGPVESARGFLLHSSDFSNADTMHIGHSIGVTGTLEALRDVATGQKPENLMFILGYAAWESGQLEAEIVQNAWLVIDRDEALIFDPDHSAKWTQAINKLGIDPGMLSAHAGRA
ncbi:MAG: YqgE/AlgH family protein [Alphaproteobacteria bacterium]